MANSKPVALNAEESKLLRSLLARVRASGTASQFADALPPSEFEEDSDGEFEHLNGAMQGMSDATKRRMVADSVTEVDAGYGKTRSCAAGVTFAVPTVRPTQVGSSGQSATPTAIPSDVTNLDDWGATVMEIGKMAPSKLSYAELAKSPDPAVVRYLKWP